MPEAKHSFDRYLLDTNHCSRVIYGDQSVINRLINIKGGSVVTCAVVSGELFFMAYKSKYKEINIQQVEKFLKDINIYPIDNEVAKVYGEIKSLIISYYGPKESEKRRRIKIEDIGFTENDLWIGAIAKSNGFIVVSSDSDFVRMREIIDLRVENWITI